MQKTETTFGDPLARAYRGNAIFLDTRVEAVVKANGFFWSVFVGGKRYLFCCEEENDCSAADESFL